uniref:Uncharacterized protein n=1 Tax=Arundo donax TaxID=35708 RepID=A0A0A9D924_ARUDO
MSFISRLPKLVCLRLKGFIVVVVPFFLSPSLCWFL